MAQAHPIHDGLRNAPAVVMAVWLFASMVISRMARVVLALWHAVSAHVLNRAVVFLEVYPRWRGQRSVVRGGCKDWWSYRVCICTSCTRKPNMGALQ